ncbi:MAG: hypothetical protein R2822_31145 [Spirosomataceae bacterium]
MEWTHKTSKIIASVLAVLLVGALVGVVYFNRQNDDLIRTKNQTELKADSLLSVKLNLEREIAQLGTDLNNQLSEAKDQNQFLEANVENAQRLLRTKTILVNKYLTESKQFKTSSGQMATQVAELEGLIDGLKSELSQTKTSNANLSNDLSALRNNLIEKNQLIEDLAHKIVTTKTMVTADDFRVDVQKINNKVTAKAKKADELLVTFLLPSILKADVQENIYMSITDLTNKPMAGSTKSQLIRAGNEEFQIPVHAMKTIDMNHAPQRVSMTFKPSEKLNQGFIKSKFIPKIAT